MKGDRARSNAAVQPPNSAAFFQPIDFHLQPADLLVQLFLADRLFGVLAPPAILEQLRRSIEQFLAPGRHLIGMHLKLARQFRQRCVIFERRQRHLGTERTRKHPPLPRHTLDLPVHGTSPSSGRNLPLIQWSSFRGPSQPRRKPHSLEAQHGAKGLQVLSRELRDAKVLRRKIMLDPESLADRIVQSQAGQL